MKRIFLYFLLVLLFQNFTFSQAADLFACPTLSVSGPSGPTRPDNQMEFTANVKNFDGSKLKLEWTITNGEIIKGQGALSLIVKPIDCQAVTTATIKVLGLPEFCQNTAFGEGLISDCKTRRPIIINEYPATTTKGAKANLDKYIVELQNEPTAIAFITKTFPRSFSKTKAYLNLQQILNYLESQGISKERVVFGAAYDIKEKTTLWIVYAGASIPEFSDEVLDAAKLTEKINDIKKSGFKKPSK